MNLLSSNYIIVGLCISILLIIGIVKLLFKKTKIIEKPSPPSPLEQIKYKTYPVLAFSGSTNHLKMYTILPIYPYERTYNAAIIAYTKNDLPSLYYNNDTKLIMVMRCNKTYNYAVLSDFLICTIKFPSMHMLYSPKVLMIETIDESTKIGYSPEDPRIISLKSSNRILLSHSNCRIDTKFDKNRHFSLKWCTIRITLFDKQFNILEKNIELQNIGRTDKWEKNWTFYEDNNGELYCIYSIMPLIVYHVDTKTWTCTEKYKYNWEFIGNKLRGSTPVVEVDNKLYMLIHTKITYDIYVLVLNKDNFKPIFISKEPILPHRRTWKIFFPVSMLYNKTSNTFFISMGVNDTYNGLIEYPKNIIDSILVPINIS